MSKKKSGSAGKMFLTGIAAAAGTYFLYGAKQAKKHRKQVKSWMLKARGEVLEQVENLEKMGMIDERKYQAAVDKVASKYRAVKNIEVSEVEDLAADLKKHWKQMIKTPPKKKN